MPNLHQQSIKSALRTVRELGEQSDRLRAHSSEVHRAYRTIFRVLKGNIDNLQIVIEALATLKASIKTIVAAYYGDAIDIGQRQVWRDLDIYDLGIPEPLDGATIAPAVASTLSLVELQADRTTAVSRLDLGEEYIIGDEVRQGTLTANPIIGDIAFWATSLAVLAYTTGTGDKMGKDAKRQAVAQVDSDTTRTCLNVHGQIVGLEEKFHLTGTPRYADDMHATPFHRGCRTAIATIMAKYLEPEVTAGMREEAIEEGKKPKPSTLKGRAHYKVVGKKVQEFRKGRWHRYKTYATHRKAREAGEKLNRDRRS